MSRDNLEGNRSRGEEILIAYVDPEFAMLNTSKVFQLWLFLEHWID